ncbi:86863650-2345-4758-b091-ac5292f6fe9c [Thermothielavioides terrestris]|uniref:86863650-2345-4758-b091-ac5292f6fe9c n=1 Tax=Thermothielavioides terrestris TaxID=2587410 RepID=A0A446BTQ6_9PEZI|nr:86863650-2345-4758-b091-ac5292f6fe9c [Thermothielavioides terrestris]
MAYSLSNLGIEGG